MTEKSWFKRNWKMLLIVGGVLAVGAVLYVVFVVLAGNAESEVDKSAVEKGDLESVKGTWVSTGNSKKQEIFFIAEGPKTAKGKFQKFDVEFVNNGDLSSAQIKVSVKASSIFTDNSTRDGHLKGEDFFNSEKHPEITFVSESIEVVDKEKGLYKTKGILTFLGKEKDFDFQFTYRGKAKDKELISFEGKFGFKQFALGMPSDDSIGKTTDVTFYVDLVPSGDAPAPEEDDEEEDDWEDEEDDWEDEEGGTEMELNQEYDDILNQVEEEAENL